MYLCNLENTDLQNIPKMSTHINLRIRFSFDQEKKNNPKHLPCNSDIFLGDLIILHNLQNTSL